MLTVTPGIYSSSSTPFVFVVDTTKAGSANDTFVLPIASGSTSITVDWGDSNSDSFITAGNKTHTYSAPGEYTVSVTGRWSGIFFQGAGDCLKMSEVQQWGNLIWGGMYQAFMGCENLTFSYTDEPAFNLTNYDFNDAFAQTKLNNDVSWLPSGIIGMSNMFYACTDFNQDLSSLDTSSCTDMSAMFAACTSFNGNITNWDTSACTSMISMFYGCTAFNQNISTWDVSSVTDMSIMFYTCSNFNQNIGSWNTSSCITMSSMFFGCSVFNQNISGWDTSLVTDMSYMLYNATLFNQNLATWNVSSVTTMEQFAFSAGFSSANVDHILIGFAAQAPTIQSGVLIRLGSGTRTSASNAAVSTLTGAPYNWVLTNP